MHKRISPIGSASLAAEVRQAGLNQEEIARELGISQSQVSRVLAGRNKRDSKIASDIRALLALRAEPRSPHSVLQHTDLINAITAVWDGSVEHGKAIAGVIRSLGPLRINTSKERPAG